MEDVFQIRVDALSLKMLKYIAADIRNFEHELSNLPWYKFKKRFVAKSNLKAKKIELIESILLY